jgi:hypothetical protein
MQICVLELKVHGCCLDAFVLFCFNIYSPHYDLGIGRGGIERMIVFPVLMWALGFGGFMMGSK